MNLIELYNTKLKIYKETGIKDNPDKLLAMLLLPEKDKFKPLNACSGEFYQKYKKEIDEKIIKVETDFNFTKDEIIEIIENNFSVYTDDSDYEHNKIWFAFSEGFGVLQWGIIYRKNLTSEEIFEEFYGDSLEINCCSNCSNGSCKVEYNEKVGLDEDGLPKGFGCVGYTNSKQHKKIVKTIR